MPTDHERAFLDALQSVGVARPRTDEKLAAPSAAVTAANIWRHPDAHPIALDALMVRRYGGDWLGWEPETLQIRVPEDFKVSELSDLNLAKLQACRTLHLVDSFWHRWEVLLACLMPFNSELPDFTTMQVPTVAQCLVAVDCANRIREESDWSEEVKAYLTVVYRSDEMYILLPPVDFITLDVPEGLDSKALAERWPAVRSSGHAPTGQNAIDEQLRRALSATEFLEESRSRLRQQLGLHE
jgi:hypothetical protein